MLNELFIVQRLSPDWFTSVIFFSLGTTYMKSSWTVKYFEGFPFTPFFHITLPFDVQELSILPSESTAIPYEVSRAGATAFPPITDCQSGFSLLRS